LKATTTIAAAILASFVSAPAFAVDWAEVKGTEIVLFYPGQSSYEWALTPTAHSGGYKVREGKNCHQCHISEEKGKGERLVSGRPLINGETKEPSPIAGKPGSIAANVKFARDDKNLYVHLEFAEGTQPDARMDPEWATKVTMMLSGDGTPEAQRFGCWSACHDDDASMPSAGTAQRTKYLGDTRVTSGRQGGGDVLKSADELAALRAGGYQLEYWQARLNPGAKAVAASGTVFDKRETARISAVTADAGLANGTWSVTLSRPLIAGAPYRDLLAGKTYTVGFAIHADHTAKRFHYVSFERTLTLDGTGADFVAAKQ